MGELLALAAAVCFGLNDFVSGLLSRTTPFAARDGVPVDRAPRPVDVAVRRAPPEDAAERTPPPADEPAEPPRPAGDARERPASPAHPGGRAAASPRRADEAPRRERGAVVAFYGQLGGTALVLGLALLVGAPRVDAASLGWGALSGIGTGIGLVFLFRGIGIGRMSVVVPLSDLAGVALPVLVGVLFLADRPSPLAWCGIALALPALWLVAGGRLGGSAVDTRFGLFAGVGFALQFVALAPVDPAAGLWPLVASRAASVLTILPMVRGRLPRRLVPPALASGMVGTLAIVLYTLATRQELMAVAVVLASLYPAIPVLLGLTVLRERLTPTQAVGLGGAAVAIVLLAAP
ncbi:hypothetical protein SAMN05421810_10715 [Amycolatopsis arida]|uniref:EamA domain-containing protein n=1 Tax=Amycolatopsis arida TaxID=587909 RepID=A0A1I5Y9F1_9PSEU|nr:DMT family transporter [Amycolatopsis arida]TDX90371.1 hypothetical protein CLV69_10715 [Amycolatopsis arida]SFQ40829.1 hypothetical protein SAMN05421810_10715 [Amycolatopsis arida]